VNLIQVFGENWERLTGKGLSRDFFWKVEGAKDYAAKMSREGERYPCKVWHSSQRFESVICYLKKKNIKIKIGKHRYVNPRFF